MARKKGICISTFALAFCLAKGVRGMIFPGILNIKCQPVTPQAPLATLV